MMENIHLRKVISWPNSFSSSWWKWLLHVKTHFHHQDGNGNWYTGFIFITEMTFRPLWMDIRWVKLISIAEKSFSLVRNSFPSSQKLIFNQPEFIFITVMEMTFAGEIHFHFHDGNEFPRSEFIFIMEMEMTFAMMEKSHSGKSHFLELANKSHFIFITRWK